MSFISICFLPLRHRIPRCVTSIFGSKHILTRKSCIYNYEPLVRRIFSFIPDAGTDKILASYVPIRTRYRKKEEDSSDSEDEAETVEDVGKDFKILKLRVNSLRADLVLKAALGMARNKVEAAIFQNKVRLNGGNIMKKSAQLHVEDEVDLVRGASKLNPKFIVISRVKLLSYSQKEDKYMANVQCFRSLTIENYPNDPWRATELSQVNS